jgi:hypothetical protein
MKRNIIVSLLGGLVGFGMLLVLLSTATVHAAGPVTNCTGQGLADAMNSGSGLIEFSCGPAPVVITVTQAGGFYHPNFDYTIDGGNLVTLSGGHANRLFTVKAGRALTLTNITLTDGYASTSAGGDFPTQGGAVLNEGIRLVLDHVTIRNSQSSYAGGAIRNVDGTTIIMNSLIENNQSDYGGGIDSVGTLTLINSTVQNNHAMIHNGGGLDVAGTVVISNSQIIGNSADGDSNGGGGGLNITALGRVSISGSQLNANQTPTQTTAATGGAIRNFGVLTITQSILNGNSANDGGGLYNDGTSAATLSNVIFSGNSGYDGGGGIYHNNGTLTLNNVTLSDNSGGGGGGLFNYATAIVNNSTLRGNSASAGGGIYNLGTATLTNNTLSGNSATNQGGGLYNYFEIKLLNVTLSNNSAATGGALFMESGYTTVLTNTILAYSSAGGNCSGTLIAVKFSLSSDNSCALIDLINGHDPNGLDPLLTGLGNYGGPTWVHMLKPGSPAIAGVVGNDAPSTDQRGQPRPGTDGSYDIGAVERQSGDSSLAPRVYLPLALKNF